MEGQMRRRPRTDGNQVLLVVQMRERGMTVQSLAMIGGGVPDLLVGCRGKNYLFEVKDPTQPPSKRRLTPDEVMVHRLWCGSVAVVETIDDVMKSIFK
jgi:hypothetical protein